MMSGTGRFSSFTNRRTSHVDKHTYFDDESNNDERLYKASCFTAFWNKDFWLVLNGECGSNIKSHFRVELDLLSI